MISQLIDIRRAEWKRATLAFSILLLVVASYTIVKTVRDALFLSRFGVTELSVIAIGLAVLTGFVVAVYLRRTAGVSRPILIGVTNGVVAVSLLLIWLGLAASGLAGILAWVLYAWSSIFGVFTVMQFWLLANDLFDPREAKRLFGPIGSGAIVGGVVGGVVSRWFAEMIGTRDLLLVAAVMLLVEGALVSLVWPMRRAAEPQRIDGRLRQGQIAGGMATVRRDPYLRLIAWAVLASTVATTLLGWQFLGIAKAHFGSRTDEMTAFFGTLSAYLSGASFIIQTLATSWLLRLFGVGFGLLALPVALLVGAGLIFNSTWVPGLSLLMAASAARVAEGGTRFAVDRACMELMWVPVPTHAKEQGKAFVDTVMDRLGTGVAGLVWLLLAAFALDDPARIHWISLAVAGVVIGWLLLISRARRGYVDAFRQLLSLRETDLRRLRVNIVDGEAQRMVAANLASDDPREVLFALYLLEDWPGVLPDLDRALRHSNPAVVHEALVVLRRRRDVRHRARAVECVSHPTEDVREAAIEYLHSTALDGPDPLIEALTRSARVERATIEVIKLGVAAYQDEALVAIRQQLVRGSLSQRVYLLRLLGAAPPESVGELVRASLTAEEPEVVQAGIFAAGRSRAGALARPLVALLGDWRHRRAAGLALRRMPAAALDPLSELAADDTALPAARQAAVRLLGVVGSPARSGLLLSIAAGEDFDLGRRALRALNRLRAQVEIDLNPASLDRLVSADVRALYRDLLYLRRGSWADLRQTDRPSDLLSRALAERANDRVERIFLVLSLRYNSADVRAAYRGLRSPLKSIRASGLELLDNILSGEVKPRLMPLLESGGQRAFVVAARSQEGLVAEQRAELLDRCLSRPDVLLQAVACWTIGDEKVRALRGDVRRLAEGGDALGAVARRALARLDAESLEEPTMGLTAIEKALKLQKVDVLQHASTEDLAHIAQIAEELKVSAPDVVYREGDAPDALFVLVSGKVRLHRDNVEIAVLGPGEAFGSWALVDESPRVASAAVAEDATLLRVGRDEFVELLADRVDIVQAVFRAMVARLRQLAGVSSLQRGTVE